LNEMHAEHRSLDVLAQAASGLQQAGRYEEAIRWARQALERDGANIGALLTLAESLHKLADGETRWDRDKVREAIKCFRQVQRQQPEALVLANNIAWLELKALGLPDDAYDSAAPMRAVPSMDRFPPAFLETLGAIELERQRYEEARNYLERAIKAGEPQAS